MTKPPKGWITCKRQAAGEIHINVEHIDYVEALPSTPATTRVDLGTQQIVVEMNHLDFMREIGTASY